VKRVLTRYFAVEGFPGEREVERRLWELADRCTPGEQVADYTQAIMDLGATVCTRASPACLLCPVSSACVARTTNDPERYQTPRPRKPRPQREAWLVLARRGREVLLEKRPPTGIWGGLWGLPEFPTRAHASQWCHEHLATGSASMPEAVEPLRHAFSHFDLEMRPLVVQCSDRVTSLRDDARYRWYDTGAPAAVGLPRPIAVLLERAARA
jgi:A/G-specific adenine glycosylase